MEHFLNTPENIGTMTTLPWWVVIEMARQASLKTTEICSAVRGDFKDVVRFRNGEMVR